MSSKISSFTAEREKLMEATFTNYRNRIIEKKSNNDYRVGHESATSMQEAKKLVDASFKIKLNII
jgi:hypothetical protein